MAKLVDLLAKYLVEWPNGVLVFVQEGDKELFAGYEKLTYKGKKSWYGEGKYFGVSLKELADDWNTSQVTQRQYLAARDRLHAETVKEMRQTTNADADQALWDKVAIAALQSLMPIYWEESYQYDSGKQLVKCQVESAFEYADAFMAERAKRMKKAQAHEN